MTRALPWLLLALMICLSCSKDSGGGMTDVPDPDPDSPNPETPEVQSKFIPASTQRLGDAQKGFEYLTTGDYINSGIPYDAYILGFGENTDNYLGRTGDNAVVSYEFTAVTAPNGVRVVGPNCMQCHAGLLNDEFVMGLGNHSADFTVDRSANSPLLDAAISSLYGGQGSPEWAAYDQFRKGIEVIGPRTVTETRGSNPADKILQTLVAHRDKQTLEWIDDPQVTLTDEVIPTDVPAWWLLKKKNAMFYHGITRMDYCKSLMAASLLTLADGAKAIEVDSNMPDVLAYIYSLEAPEYPFGIDTELASQGKGLFDNNCASCHGTYGSNASYPNLLVSLSTVGTDRALSDHYSTSSEINDYFMDFFNNGWFGTDDNPLLVLAEGGYVAQPLDGIWATAPYFHNGSVPTLEDVLNSSSRPRYWSRNFSSTEYDQLKVGWSVTEETSKVNRNTYDTTLKGYGNQGHTFGDSLSESERQALLEYLKTL
ncbi:c-type cytochrome [Poritiphilus flavus]|uniref:C-type cytochrome n=1 Tax=Poritiphilus flavus TaxID=2697053 RepID=A0A6L9EEQ9_9FLAO|nr:c-type cytochrome [Poritiphilus flavus]NAS13250.1 c-type cytochrome [Poritiphilus flavus]